MFGVVRAARCPDAPTGRCTEQMTRVEGDDAAPEMAVGKAFDAFGVFFGGQQDGAFHWPAIPDDFDIERAKDFPTGGVGHGQREAAIGVAIGESVHPVALALARDDLGGGVVDFVTVELHRASPLC